MVIKKLSDITGDASYEYVLEYVDYVRKHHLSIDDNSLNEFKKYYANKLFNNKMMDIVSDDS